MSRRKASGHGPGAMDTKAMHAAFYSDFTDAWQAVGESDAPGRGNFMFAMLSLTYFEWCAHVVDADADARGRFVDALDNADAFYFSRLPAPYTKRRPDKWFPTRAGDAREEWGWLMFNVIRNGLAHRYQQPDIELVTGGYVRFGISGPEQPQLRTGARRPADYLRQITGPGVGPFIYLRFDPDVFFDDVHRAAQAAQVWTLPVPKWSQPVYRVSFDDLASSLPSPTRKV